MKKFSVFAGAVMVLVIAVIVLMLAWSGFSSMTNDPNTVMVIVGSLGMVVTGLIFGGSMFFMGKKVIKFLMASVVMMAVFLGGCTVVQPGYVGIKVNQWGDERGVEDYPVRTGIVGYNPFTSEVYKFPTFQQRIVWTADDREGSPTDESITFNSAEGASINIDVALAMSFESAKVPQIFIDYKIPAERIVDGYIRDRVRAHIVSVASTMKVADIFGEGQAELVKQVEKGLQDELGPKGFVINNVSFLCRPRVSETVENSINAVIAQKQKAIEAEQKVMQATAEANQAIAKAEGEKATKVLASDAEAYKITTLANAQAEANKKVAESINEKLIQYEQINKWNGSVPTTVLAAGSVPLLNVK
jgi:regulator of protease activity HflC (stomatin/prohibitin superfamily)